MLPVLTIFWSPSLNKSVFFHFISSLLPRVLYRFRKDKCKDSFSKKRARKFLQHFSLMVSERVSYCLSLPWSLIMTDVHGAEFTYIIVSSRAGKRIFIVEGGGTERHGVETEDKTRVQLGFFSIEIKYNHFLSFLSRIYFEVFLLQLYFVSIKCSLCCWLKNWNNKALILFF